MSRLADNLETIQARIASAAQTSGRSPSNVTLIAVTKTVPVERICEAYAIGLRHFGENRVQEALSKFEARTLTPVLSVSESENKVQRDGVTLHMIGSLQRNKAAAAAQFFDMVHSVDRIELAEALAQAVERVRTEQGRAGEMALVLPVLIEVNVTGEASKSGVAVNGLQALAEKVGDCGGLRGVGLMTIARLGASEVESRRTFAQLRYLLETIQGAYPGDWHHLSMGMSDDYEHAIREGATMIRLGRALFGERSV